jgi:hypothetical protein
MDDPAEDGNADRSKIGFETERRGKQDARGRNL